MSVTLNFDLVYQFDTTKSGITVPTMLIYGERKVNLPAKVDTDSTNCVFSREHANHLRIEIENGEETYFGAATGRFLTFGHEVTLKVFDISIQTMVCFIAEEGIKRNILGRLGFLAKFNLV